MSTVRPLRLGRIDYINTFPFFHNLEGELGDERVEFVHAVPAEINKLMRQGKIDAALVSSLEYALSQEKYYVFSDGCIGSKGITKSVMLFSKFPIDQLNGRQIALSSESLSSAGLLKILLKEKYGFKNNFVENLRFLSDMLAKADAALVIGDQALFAEREHKEKLFVYDLCSEWSDWQELPFCFALWVVRKYFADEYPDRVRALGLALEQNVKRNLENVENLFSLIPVEVKQKSERQNILDYWQRLSYRLDPEMLKGLERFYESARKMKILDREILVEYAHEAEAR